MVVAVWLWPCGCGGVVVAVWLWRCGCGGEDWLCGGMKTLYF